MPLKIDGYTSFDDAFKQSPELVWTVAKSLLAGRSFQERHALLNDLSLAAAKAYQDEQLLVLLQMKRKLTDESVKAAYASRTDFQYATERDRAAEREAETVYRAHIAELYWQLPDHQRVRDGYRDQDGFVETGTVPAQTLVAVKARIFRELLHEWTYQATEASVHAFRRAIAMGWPMSSQYARRRGGEDNVELRARGRYVSQEEQKQYAAAVREHLGSFDCYAAKALGPDAVFGPWLMQQHVPEDVQKFLIVARAKMGGIELARRDTSYAAVLAGLPVSGIAQLDAAAGAMRVWYADAQSVVKAVVEAQRQRYPHWRGDTLPHTITFVSQKDLNISFTRCQDDDEQSAIFGDANVAIAAARSAGHFKDCTIRLDVDRPEEGTAILRNAWYS